MSDVYNKIIAPNGLYHGAFANYYTDEEHLACFEIMAGSGKAGKADISTRFMNIKELSALDTPFPTAEAERMQERGGALYIVLEPGRGQRFADGSFPPEKIIEGKYDDLIINFAEEAEDFGGPMFFTFRGSRSTSYAPEVIKNAYLYLRKKITAEGAHNITWAWTVNLDDPNFYANAPAAAYIDWISVPLYQTDENNFSDVIAKLERNIHQLRKFGKPILVEFGSNAPTPAKSKIIKKAVEKFAALGVKGFITNNVSQREGSLWKTWSISAKEERSAYQEAIARHEKLLRENIKTRKGYLPGEPTPVKDLDCKAVESRYFTAEEAKSIAITRDKLERLNGAYKLRGMVPLEYLSDQKIALSRNYRYLFGLIPVEKYLEKAIQYLKDILNNPVPKWGFGSKKYPYVDKYFDLKLELAESYRMHDNSAAVKECQAVLSRLTNEQFLEAQNVKEASVKGYENRAKLIMGLAYYNLGRFAKAENILKQVAKWSEYESGRNWLILWWKGEKREDLKYNAAQASKTIAFSNIYKKGGDLNKALSIFKQTLRWEKVGEEDGFMDLAFASLIGAMRVYLLQDPERARLRFNHELNWGKINKYKDLKKAFNLEEVDLSSDKVDKWGKILFGLSMVLLPDDLKNELAIINAFN